MIELSVPVFLAALMLEAIGLVMIIWAVLFREDLIRWERRTRRTVRAYALGTVKVLHALRLRRMARILDENGFGVFRKKTGKVIEIKK